MLLSFFRLKVAIGKCVNGLLGICISFLGFGRAGFGTCFNFEESEDFFLHMQLEVT
jgi:hypothetical protein